jgi:large subunit ribosomal protein L4
MPTVKVVNLKNEEVGSADLSDAVFGAELNEALIHAAVRNYLANGRAGTSATKTRGNTSGSGRKLWRQKGTGRARIASIRSPLWKGGGNAHGPQPRDWSYNMPKKMRRGALRSALSERLREGNLLLLDGFNLAEAKTKQFVGALASLGLEGKTLVVDSLENVNLLLAARNVKRAKVVNSYGVNIYDLLYHEKIALTREAADELAALLDPHRVGGPAEEVEEAAPVEPAAKPAKAKEAPVEEPAPVPVEEVVAEPVAETTVEAVDETAPEAVAETAAAEEPVIEAVEEVVAEPAAETVEEPAAEPVAETVEAVEEVAAPAEAVEETSDEKEAA